MHDAFQTDNDEEGDEVEDLVIEEIDKKETDSDDNGGDSEDEDVTTTLKSVQQDLAEQPLHKSCTCT